MPFNLGVPELMIVLVIVLLLFGPKKLPDFAKSMGQAIKEFKHASNEMMSEIHRAADEPKPQSVAASTATAEKPAQPEAPASETPTKNL